MVNFKFLAGIFIFSVTATVGFAQPSAQIDTSDWASYRNEQFGFEVKYPKSLHERGITGTVNDVPVERVAFNTTPVVGKSQEGIQFAIQRGINPSGLSFDRWSADQLRKFNKAPPQSKNMVIGGRPAIMLNYTSTFGVKYDIHISLNKTDILSITIMRPSSETQLDQTYKTILSTIKFLN